MKIGNLILKEDKSVTAAMCDVGPDEALELLKRNKDNRPVSSHTVQKYMDEINHQWYASPQGIGFDLDGLMVDGQHRLIAISKQTKHVPLLIVCGVPRMVRLVLDRQRKRNYWHNKVMAGGKWVTADIGSVANILSKYLRNEKAGNELFSNRPSSDAEVDDVMELYKDQLMAVHEMIPSGVKILSSAPFRTAMVVAYDMYGDKITEFVNEVFSEIHTDTTSPTLRLRCNLRDFNKSTGQVASSSIFKRTCYAFNAWISGRKICKILEADWICAQGKTGIVSTKDA